MSELTTRFVDDTYAEYYNTGKHELAQIYLKSEADKVIAEKDKEIAELNDKALQYKVLDKEHCRDLNTQERRFALQMAHHKHKRCLAMAKWCDACRFAWSFIPEDDEVHKSDFYDKWKERWLELAKKFKEAK